MPTELNSTAPEASTRLPHLHTLDVRVERRIARVTIDHEPINLMDATLVGELDQLVDWLAEQGDSVRVVIFQSAVPEFFLAHLDLGLIQATIDDPEPDVALESFQGLVTRYSRLDQVTIAKVAGRVGGGGSEFLLNLDLRFAVRGRAVFNQFETGLGILPAGSGSQHLPRLLGRGRALEVILGHDDVDAEIAERYGWVNRAFDAASIDAFIDRLASRIASQRVWLLAAAKRAADALVPSFQHGLELEREASRIAFAAPEPRALIADFLARGGQTVSGERRLAELLGELSASDR
jgi:enoyl-CoA hydratase/carnithine racemase